jgi:glutaredoxin 3
MNSQPIQIATRKPPKAGEREKLVRRAKRYCREHRVPFKEVDVERDPEVARDIARKTSQRGVPVIKIGNRWIVGFDKERIEKELGLS